MASAPTPAPAPTGGGTPPATPAATPTSWAPTAKVSAGVLAAAAVTLLLPLVKNWLTHAGATDTSAAGAALTTIITFLVQYFVPERK